MFVRLFWLKPRFGRKCLISLFFRIAKIRNPCRTSVFTDASIQTIQTERIAPNEWIPFVCFLLIREIINLHDKHSAKSQYQRNLIGLFYSKSIICPFNKFTNWVVFGIRLLLFLFETDELDALLKSQVMELWMKLWMCIFVRTKSIDATDWKQETNRKIKWRNSIIPTNKIDWKLLNYS